jgi:hypothetical protein
MSDAPDVELTADDHRLALTEVSFLTDIFAATVNDLMGGASASVGRIAGRHMARKLPVELVDPSLEQVLDAVASHVRRGFDITYTRTETGVDLTFGRCAMREVCRTRDTRPGGHVCQLYHQYFDGLINELHARPTKSTIAVAGDTCQIRMETR